MTVLDMRVDVLVLSVDFLLFHLLGHVILHLVCLSRAGPAPYKPGNYRDTAKGRSALSSLFFMSDYKGPRFYDGAQEILQSRYLNILLWLLALWISLAHFNVFPYLSNIGAFIEPLKGTLICSTQRLFYVQNEIPCTSAFSSIVFKAPVYSGNFGKHLKEKVGFAHKSAVL